MRTIVIPLFVGLAICLILPAGLASQSGPTRQKSVPTKKADPGQSKSAQEPDTQKEENQRDADAVRLDTTLVVVPVIASDRNLIYVPDMRKDEFTLDEDGVKQEIVFFATIKEPFHVVLMLDTSASTKERLREIQQAARAFVDQLQPADRVKVISFDDQVRDLGDFTSDRAQLRVAIDKLQPGKGTKLYDAVDRALVALQYLEGRKAIVLFTDGVDMTSDNHHLEDNIRALEESGVIVYPIRYDTRVETEAMLRRQSPIPGMPPTLPGDTIPGDPRDKRDPRTLPLPPPVIVGRPPSRYPGDGYPGGSDRFPDNRSPDRRLPDPSTTDPRQYPRQPGRRDGDSISVMLDKAYQIADEYLLDLCLKSGGKLHRADTLVSLPAAFGRIADELRTQYALGYYPKNSARDGSYRKIQVRTSRKKVVIRARPGYRG